MLFGLGGLVVDVYSKAPFPKRVNRPILRANLAPKTLIDALTIRTPPGLGRGVSIERRSVADNDQHRRGPHDNMVSWFFTRRSV